MAEEGRRVAGGLVTLMLIRFIGDRWYEPYLRWLAMVLCGVFYPHKWDVIKCARTDGSDDEICERCALWKSAKYEKAK